MMNKVIRSNQQAAKACGEILALDFSSPRLIKITDYKPPKTTPQLRYAHSLMGFIAKAKKCSPEVVKTDCKREFGEIKVCTSSITGERTARLISLADYSRKEIEVFITQIEHFCDSNSINYIEARNSYYAKVK